jgi:hypothetical protein
MIGSNQYEPPYNLPITVQVKAKKHNRTDYAFFFDKKIKI